MGHGLSVWRSGSATPREMQMAEQAGYQCAFMNIGGGFGASLPRFAFPRVHVTADMSLAEFEAHLSGFHRDFRSRLSGATKLFAPLFRARQRLLNSRVSPDGPRVAGGSSSPEFCLAMTLSHPRPPGTRSAWQSCSTVYSCIPSCHSREKFSDNAGLMPPHKVPFLRRSEKVRYTTGQRHSQPESEPRLVSSFNTQQDKPFHVRRMG